MSFKNLTHLLADLLSKDLSKEPSFMPFSDFAAPDSAVCLKKSIRLPSLSSEDSLCLLRRRVPFGVISGDWVSKLSKSEPLNLRCGIRGEGAGSSSEGTLEVRLFIRLRSTGVPSGERLTRPEPRRNPPRMSLSSMSIMLSLSLSENECGRLSAKKNMFLSLVFKFKKY